MSAAKRASRGTTKVSVLEDLELLKDVLEHAPINIMMADADEKVIFLNRRARETLGGLEQELAAHLPGFRADQIEGGSIHRYHRDPEAIKRVLSALRTDEIRKGEITPGRFVFVHETRVLVNRKGERVGYVVQWRDVTEERAKAEQSFRLQRAIDGAQTAMMTVDRDLVITYVNEETKALLKNHEQTLRQHYPGFSADAIVGTCIDIFHKNPAHQRRLLADPRNLPFESDIQVGPLTFHIRVSAMNDLAGNYIGNTLEWKDVTELRTREKEVARLTSAVEGSTTALMMADIDGTITYMNPAVTELLSAHQDKLRKIFPGFDAHKLVGKSIDDFHANPKHQRAILADPRRMPYTANIKVAGLEFSLTVTAITDQSGRHIGNTVEWKDVTELMDAQRQVEALIGEATQGKLDSRIDTSHYNGFMKNIGDGVNHLLEAVITPIRESTQVLSGLAQGNLHQRLEGDYKGEFAVLRDAIHESLQNLQDMVSNIREAAKSIASSASEISQGNVDLSQRTEEQASSLEETASSMEELTSTVKQNADNARQANQLAANARTQAEQGGEVVSKAISAMAEINSSSKKIADIIGVIDEIAFQTNLLALNAAVEAARAGEQGRGFAVVAAEVRNLAQRSAGAAKEIKTLIKDSVEKVDDGTRLVDESGNTLQEIVKAVKKVSDIVAEIAAASQEQSAGIEQVNKAVMQMDEVTQQNAALVEEAAAASESLDEQAQALTRQMAFFKVSEQDEVAPARTRERESARAPVRSARPAPGKFTASARPSARAARAAPASHDDQEWEEF